MWKKIEVNSYSGYKSDESPRRFVLEGKPMQIKEILDRWYEGGLRATQPKLDYFKVLTETNKKYLLRYNSLFDAWALWEK